MFPAPAGINRVKHAVNAISARVPRASGDKPGIYCAISFALKCSPRQRG
ncbi:hypothetical protein ECDEC15B_3171 [Escherichia coli DEC15B]|nr:hypothetical protein ECDEC15A_3490 [Escherichia coli DEC15A]EHY03918.1 hypothetical protein ECDEC15B_3171 [Escherichia coli DEC15B]EHY05450.1 hypothetical protein ECDEC15C_3199 [Escherichia coli DEC15C]EHY12861.1 hypothetical protein ECDEC15D_3151 [Escherichia coli DEC15D]EHY18208.1 hypothetical protein ECDEC15E_3453 [Escherichia coli DEC15E]KDX01682.1 hypothetical protein AC17_0595 [Escherichia coli 2-210-07_S3_C2]